MLTNLKNLTNKELIEVLKQYPMDATVSIETFNSKCKECNAIQYNDLGNEIILSHFDTNIKEFIEPIDIFELTEEDEDEEIYRACGIW